MSPNRQAFSHRSCVLAVALVLAAGCYAQESVELAPRVAEPAPREDTAYVRVVPGRTYRQTESIEVAPIVKVRCPGGTGETVTRSIGPAGGEIRLAAGHSLTIPQGVLRQETAFTLSDVPSARHLQVRADGGGGQPLGGTVYLTLNFERCPREETDGRPLRVIRERLSGPADDVSGEIFEDRRAIRTAIDRLSVFAIGF